MIVSIDYIIMIKDIYNGVIIGVRAIDGDTNMFPIMVDLCQRSALNSFLSMLVIDNLTGYIQNDISWYMLLVNDIVLVDEIRIGVSCKLEL